MHLSVTARRYVFSLLTTLTIIGLAAGFIQVNAAARAVMSENAVPRLLDSGDGIIESLFSGGYLSALRSVIAKIFPYAALVLEILIFIFFVIVEGTL